MTNREWLNSLDDCEFAKWLKNEFSLTYECFYELFVWLAERKEIDE